MGIYLASSHSPQLSDAGFVGFTLPLGGWSLTSINSTVPEMSLISG